MAQSTWNRISDSPYDWVSGVNLIMESASIPEFKSDWIYITSDYGGSHTSSRYSAVSVMAVDLESSASWEYKRRWLRAEHFKDNRRISYKTLNDRQRRQALPWFLDAASDLQGVCVTFLVDKSIKGLVTYKQAQNDWRGMIGLTAKWNPLEFERMVRIAHFVSIVTAGLVREGQSVYWISDQENFFASTRHSTDTARVLSQFTSKYCQFNLGELGIGTTSLDEGDRVEEDLAAIPDLVAGALADFVTGVATANTSAHWWEREYEVPSRVRIKSRYIVDWIYNAPKRHRHEAIVFEKGVDNRLYYFAFDPPALI